MKNNSLKKLAVALKKNGVSSLRYDKRGVGKSAECGSNEIDLRFEHFIHDAENWIEYLTARSDLGKVFVIGHCEGSLIGLVASQRDDVRGFVSVAGSGVDADEKIKEHLETASLDVLNIATPVIDSLKRGQTVDKVPPLAYFQFNPSTQPFLISLFSYNPKKEMYKLDIPTLVVQGTNDLQANIGDARRLFSAAKKGGIIEIQDMNHILKVVPRDLGENLKSYNKPDLEISHELVESVSKFIKSYH